MSSQVGISSSDIFYVTLPLYHSMAFGMGLMTSILSGKRVEMGDFGTLGGSRLTVPSLR